MADDSEFSAAHRARLLVGAMDATEDQDVVTDLGAEARTWALLSIAESLERIADHGIETYELDRDGHRRYS